MCLPQSARSNVYSVLGIQLHIQAALSPKTASVTLALRVCATLVFRRVCVTWDLWRSRDLCQVSMRVHLQRWELEDRAPCVRLGSSNLFTAQVHASIALRENTPELSAVQAQTFVFPALKIPWRPRAALALMTVSALLVTHGREGIAFHVLQEHTKRQTEPKSARSVLSASS